MSKDTSVIPFGDYCYSIDRVDLKESKIYVKQCPYSTYKIIADVHIPYCEYLEQMGSPNCNDEDYAKLLAFYGNHDNLSKVTPLSLLFDDCKECGINESNECEINVGEIVNS